jgi:hypothetical protein
VSAAEVVDAFRRGFEPVIFNTFKTAKSQRSLSYALPPLVLKSMILLYSSSKLIEAVDEAGDKSSRKRLDRDFGNSIIRGQIKRGLLLELQSWSL